MIGILHLAALSASGRDACYHSKNLACYSTVTAACRAVLQWENNVSSQNVLRYVQF
jgi:hypothetical protein